MSARQLLPFWRQASRALPVELVIPHGEMVIVRVFDDDSLAHHIAQGNVILARRLRDAKRRKENCG